MELSYRRLVALGIVGLQGLAAVQPSWAMSAEHRTVPPAITQVTSLDNLIPITLGETVQGRLTASNPEDRLSRETDHHTRRDRLIHPEAAVDYVIPARAGETLIISVNSWEFSPYLTIGKDFRGIFLPEEFVWGWSPTSSGGGVAAIRWTVPETGEYQIQIEALGSDNAGGYRLDVITGDAAQALAPALEVAQALSDYESRYEIPAGISDLTPLARTIATYWGRENWYGLLLSLRGIVQQLESGAGAVALTQTQTLVADLQAAVSNPALVEAAIFPILTDMSRDVVAHAFRGEEAVVGGLLEDLLQIYATVWGEGHENTLSLRQQIAQAYLSRGNTLAAERILEPVLASRATTGYGFPDAPEPYTSAIYDPAFFLLQGLSFDTGDFQAAEAAVRQALSQTDDLEETVFLWAQLADVLVNQQNYEAVIALGEEAVAALSSPPFANWEDSFGIQLNLNGLLSTVAYAYGVLGQSSEAEATLQRLRPPAGLTLTQTNQYRDNLSTSVRIALYRAQGRHGEVEMLLRQQLQAWRAAGGEDAETSSWLNLLAEALWAQGQIAEAVTVRQRALELEEQRIATALVGASSEQVQRYLSAMGFQEAMFATLSASVQRADYAPATALGLTNVLQRKGRTLDLLVAQQRYLQAQPSAADQALIDQLAAARSQLASFTYQSHPPDPAQVTALQAEIHRLEGQLVSRVGIAENLSEVTTAAVQQQLPAQAALVEYVRYQPYDPRQPEAYTLGEPRYMAYVLQPQGAVAAIDLGEATTIDPLVETLRRQLQDPFTNLEAVRQAGRELHQALVEPLPLGNAQHLLLAPDGQLNLIPFAALIDSNQRYLVEVYRLTYLTSGRDLLRAPTAAAPNPAVFIANPDYNRAEIPATVTASRGLGVVSARAPELRQLQFGPLPGTVAEVNAIAPLLSPASILTGAQATETALKQIQGPRILHIATHGFFLEDVSETIPQTSETIPQTLATADGIATHPLLRSGLALAGFNPRESPPDDGVLTALEASGLNLQGTQLAVLSACDTGLGEVITGEGVYGLRRAFTLAGAESQLTSLWQVDDFATKDLMVAYYQRLLNREGRSEALRQVQLAFIQGDAPRQHPYFWAAFSFSGQWQPLADPSF